MNTATLIVIPEPNGSYTVSIVGHAARSVTPAQLKRFVTTYIKHTDFEKLKRDLDVFQRTEVKFSLEKFQLR
jgi:hypothetical protein